MGKYTLDSVAHGVKRPNHLMEVTLAVKAINREVRLHQPEVFPSPTLLQSCWRLTGGVGQPLKPCRAKACLDRAHLGPMEAWKWAYMADG